MIAIILAVVALSDDLPEPSGPLCGQYALEIIVGKLLGPSAIPRVADALKPFEPPYSLQELAVAVKTMGLDSEIVNFKPGEPAWTSPAILWLSSPGGDDSVGHFAACFGSGEHGFCMVDPPYQPTLVDEAVLRQNWNGTALLVDQPGAADVAGRRATRWSRYGLIGVGVLLMTIAARSAFRPIAGQSFKR